jgi:hypothetical protein
MIDGHLHLGSIPSGGKEWGSFEEYLDNQNFHIYFFEMFIFCHKN